VTPPLLLTIFDALVFIAVVLPFVLLARHRNAVPNLPAQNASQSGLEGIAANRSR